MNRSQRSSIGGAASAAGETFRADVAARIAVHILARRSIRELGPMNVPFRIILESGSEVDDIEVEMNGGGKAWIQAKRRLELSTDRQKPLASAFDQFVRQYVQAPALDPSRDHLVLAYESCSDPIAVLRTAVRRFRSDTPTPAQAAPDPQSQEALEKLHQIIATAWRDAGGASPHWSQISRLLSLIVFWELREGDDGRVEIDPSHLLSTVVEGEGAVAATDALRVFVSTLAKDRRGANANGLRRALRDAGIVLCHTDGFEQRIEIHLERLRTNWISHRPLGVLAADTAWSSALKSSEVFVSPRLQEHGSRSDTELRAETILERLRGGHPVAVLGHVGTGKSTLLLWCAAELATRSQTSGEPIPLLLHARELQATAWPDILERLLPGVGRAGSSLSWWVLVDGIDEVGSEAWSMLAMLKRRFQNIAGIVAAARPLTRPAPEDGFECLELTRWSEIDVERFLSSWARRDASAVERVRTQLGAQASADLLANPLTATAALLIAHEMNVLPRSRSGIVGCIAELLFRAWRRTRGDSKLEWSDVKPVLLTLAEIVVRGEPLTLERVRTAFASRGFAAAIDLPDEVERQLGILVKIDDCHFEFVHRSIAEHLVGESVRAVEAEVFMRIACAPWSREVIRHAIGISSDFEEHATVDSRLQELAVLARFTTFDVSALRAVSSAITAAADLAFAGIELARQPTEVLADAIVVVLFEEVSTWIGDSIIDQVKRVARAGGALWDAVLSRMVNRLRPSQDDPVHWYAGKELHVQDWISALLHRNAEVRTVAVDRLAPHIEDPVIQRMIFLVMSDEGYTLVGAPPALRAGLAWRRLTRDPSIADAFSLLRHRLTSSGQLKAGAAALALRPGEAPSHDIVQALRFLSDSCEIPQFVLDELTSTAEGQDALQEVWPDWTQSSRVTMATGQDRYTQCTGATPPPSSIVRARIVRACSPRLAGMDRATLEIIGARLSMLVSYELIAGGSVERALEQHLEHIPLDAQHELGALLLRSQDTRKRVLGLWPPPEGRLYPGIALEPLVEAGDDEAAAVYREFLPHSPYAWGILARQPLEGVLTHPLIRPDACMLAASVIDRTQTLDHTGSRLAVTSAATVLQNLTSAWCRDTTIMSRVWSLLDADPIHGLAAVLTATRFVELSASWREDLYARVRTNLEALVSAPNKLDLNTIVDAEHGIEWIEARQLANKFADILRRLGDLDHPLGWLALAVRWPAMSENERTDASRRVAESAIEESSTSLPFVYLERFVRAAPGVWCNELVVTIRNGGHIDGTVGIQALNLLPRDLQGQVVRVLQSSAYSQMELPWVRSGVDLQCARPADTVRRLIYELGEEVVIPSAQVMRYILDINEQVAPEALQALLGIERERGRQEGRLQGFRELLLRLLRQRFGDAVNTGVEQRFSVASVDQIATWSKRVLSAATLADLFED